MPRLIAICLLVLSAAAGAADFRDAKDAFNSAFRDDAPPTARKEAVLAVAAHEGKDAAKLLLSGVAFSQEILESLTERRAGVLSGKIGGFPDGDNREELSRLKGEIDREIQVLAAIEKAVEGRTDPKAINYLRREALSRQKHWKARRITAAALGKIGGADSVKPLVRALRDKDARVRSAAALSLGRLRAAEALDDLAELLLEDAWTLRAAAIEALAGIGGKEGIAALISHLRRETGRLRQDCARALAKLTGQTFGDVPDAWDRWWKENADRFGEEGSPGKPAPKPDAHSDDSYYGLPVDSDRAIFILDISESMSYSSIEYQDKPKPGEISRLELAKREFARAVQGFNSKSRFNVIVFNDEVSIWKQQMVPGSEEMKKAAKGWVRPMDATGTTNIYAAMEKAFSLVGMGAGDKRYDLAADTIYLMSDGAPTNEDASDDDPMRIIRAVRVWNGLKRIRIHAIGLKGHDAAFMSRLALENGGRYVAR